jgi:hypothetical protein
LARASRRKIKKSLLRGNFDGEETYRQRVREKNFLLRRIHAFDHRDTADARDADVRTEGHCDIILGAEYQGLIVARVSAGSPLAPFRRGAPAAGRRRR